MAKIFGCKGVCEKCEVADICPMKGELDQAFEKRLSGVSIGGEPILKKYLELKEKLDPQMIIRINRINLCNLLQRISILVEIGEITSPDSVKTQIISTIEKEKRQLLETKKYTPIKARVLLIIEEMAELIFLTVQKECPAKNCHSCWLKEECPQLSALSKSSA